MQVQKVAGDLPASVPVKVLADLAHIWRSLVVSRMDSYRPEKHYMRGPGPKWREKQTHRTAAPQS